MVKLCFSTIGCPDWSWDEIIAAAHDFGMDGIEVRGVGKEIYAPKAAPFLPENRESTMARLRAAGLCIPCLTTGLPVGDPDRSEAAAAECRDYIDLAAAIGTPYVRVMASDHPGPEPVDLDLALRVYQELCDYAAPKKVTPLIETNGQLADSKRMLRFMQDAGRENAGVLWDVHHPWRFFGETPDETISHLRKYIRHLHVKDSVRREDGSIEYRMMGRGDLPVFDCLRVFADDFRTIFCSLEWVKRWNPDLTEPGIVFPHFAGYMQYFMKKFD